jgi:glycerol-3-phosphate dehydrogenase
MSAPESTTAVQPWNREDHLNRLADTDVDVLVIGGGASGVGVLLDALSRGLSAALVDRQDFMAGTSSRSTKLIHGGVRYLEQAFKGLDYSKYELVREALAERKRMLNMAPHLAWPLTLITPVKSMIGLPYYRFGLGLYDLLSGSQRLGKSRIESKAEMKRACPSLNIKPLKGGVSYMDGQFDDARFGIAMVRSAVEQGAAVANHTEVKRLLFKDDGTIGGAECTDLLSQRSLTIRARNVVNCTGPWTDTLRLQADANARPLMTVSSGIHLVLNKTLLPDGRGILIPETNDGRVLFMLPWLGKTLVGTTDDPAQLDDNPAASQSEVDYIIKHVNEWLDEPVSHSDISATFSGLRPLVSDPDESSTSGLTRDHVVLQDKGLFSLTGGKWTTWRKMAEDCMDTVVKVAGLTAGPCQTYDLRLPGANGDKSATEAALSKLPDDIAEYLWQAYGDRAHLVLKAGSSDRLVEGAPYIEAELIWAIKFEGACKSEDVLYRRLRVGMLDQEVTRKIESRVQELVKAA